MESNGPTPAQRNVSIAIALVLLGACAAKVWAMAWGATPVTRLESLFNILLVQGELALAIWLMSRKRLPLSLAASAVFFSFASASNLRAIWLKKSSCGCFGNIEIPPEVTLGLNIALLLGIAYAFRTAKTSISSMFKVKRIGWTIPLCTGVVILALLIQLVRIQFAPRLIAIPNEIDFGMIDLGSQKEITIPLKNISGREINIWGGMTTCSCAAIYELPANVPKDSEKEVRIVLKPSNLRDINVKAMFYIESSYGDHMTTLIAKVRDSNDQD